MINVKLCIGRERKGRWCCWDRGPVLGEQLGHREGRDFGGAGPRRRRWIREGVGRSWRRRVGGREGEKDDMGITRSVGGVGISAEC